MDKVLATEAALEGHLPLVHVEVSRQGQLVIEGLTAAWAGVGLAGMDLHMLSQVGLDPKKFWTETAGELCAGVLVSSPVFDVETFVRESPVTAAALEGLLTGMNTNMLGWANTRDI